MFAKKKQQQKTTPTRCIFSASLYVMNVAKSAAHSIRQQASNSPRGSPIHFGKQPSGNVHRTSTSYTGRQVVNGQRPSPLERDYSTCKIVILGMSGVGKTGEIFFFNIYILS